MKIVILGGSAQSTPALWDWLNSKNIGDLHLILMGRNVIHLRAIVRACQTLHPTSINRIESRIIHEPDAWRGLEDARAFIIQIRNGGYAARSVDETLPLRYGICGDEGLGPGGLSAGIRNWLAIEPLLAQIADKASNALVVMMSSPVGLLVRAARSKYPQLGINGICELPWTTLLTISAAINVPSDSLQFDYLGVNHLGWFYRLESNGHDVIDRYAMSRISETTFPSAALIKACGAVPLVYLRLHYEQQDAVGEQRRNQRSRGKILAEWSREAFETYTNGTHADITRVLRRRPAPWYSHALGPFIASMAGRAADVPFFLSVPNGGLSPGFAPDDILEYAHVFDSSGLRRLIPGAPMPSHLLNLLAKFVRYERVAVEALLDGGHCGIARALEVHPWTENLPERAELATEMVSQ